MRRPTRKPARHVVETLRSTLPGAANLEIADAGRMVPMTHPDLIADAVRTHVSAAV